MEYKNWKNNYAPTSPGVWQGRADSLPGERFFQVMQCIDMTQPLPKSDLPLSYGLLGFCSDEGIRRNLGRPGAVAGPRALRHALGNIPLMRYKKAAFYDIGDIHCYAEDLEEAQASLAEVISTLLQQGIKPVVVGGGHELAWGHYQGIAKAGLQKNLGIINFDAHFDLRPLPASNKGTSGTSFRQIAQISQELGLKFDYLCLGIQHLGNTQTLFDAAGELNVTFVSADELHLNGWQPYIALLDDFIKEHSGIYVSLCLDVLASAFAPGVSSPQPLGLYPMQVLFLLQHLCHSGKIISFDIAELSPSFDIDERTAKLAANLVSEYIHHSL